LLHKFTVQGCSVSVDFLCTGGELIQTAVGMGFRQGRIPLKRLAARTNVNWQPVKLAHDQWNYRQEGLTPAGAALVAVAV
jgi:hypothetical protein